MRASSSGAICRQLRDPAPLGVGFFAFWEQFLKRLILLSPPLQIWNAFRHHAGEETGKAHFLELVFAKFLHLFRGPIGRGEGTFLVAVTTIHRRLRTVGFRSPTLRVPFQRHPATLAIFVRHLNHAPTLRVKPGKVKRPALQQRWLFLVYESVSRLDMAALRCYTGCITSYL